MPFYTSGGFKGYKHVGKSIHQGIELEADGHPLHWLGYRAGFTYINAKWDDATMRIYVYGATPSLDTVQSVDISGKRVYRVPAYQYTGSLIFTPLKPFTFSVDDAGFGKQNIDAYNRYKQNAVNLVDLKAGYRINKFLELYILGAMSLCIMRAYSTPMASAPRMAFRTMTITPRTAAMFRVE